jgi:flagellin-like protein
MKNILKGNKGASEIVGALLLIAVVIVAVSGIAVIVAQVQKNEMERQSNIDAVEKENIKIMSILPVLNYTNDIIIYLDSLNITIVNLNSQDSRIASVVINDKWAAGYNSTEENDESQQKSYNNNDRLTVPAGKSKVLSINFSTNYNPPINVSSQKALKITILTENGNTFTKLYMPPTPVIKTSIETENLGVAERDLLVLDGSDSFDDGSILSYQWNICNSSTYNSTENITLSTTGKRIRAYLNSTGPFYVWLNLTDDTNMIGISPEPVKIPENKNFNPPMMLDAKQIADAGPCPGPAGSNCINATITDLYGKGVPNVGVSFIWKSGTSSTSPIAVPMAALTDSNGNAYAEVKGTIGDSGLIQARSGTLNPVDVAVTVA